MKPVCALARSSEATKDLLSRRHRSFWQVIELNELGRIREHEQMVVRDVHDVHQ